MKDKPEVTYTPIIQRVITKASTLGCATCFYSENRESELRIFQVEQNKKGLDYRIFVSGNIMGLINLEKSLVKDFG